MPVKPIQKSTYFQQNNDLSAVKESEYEESKATVEDLRQRLDQEFSIKKSEVTRTPQLRERSPSFYDDIDDSRISKRDVTATEMSHNSVIDSRKTDEQPRNEKTKVQSLQRVEPLNL